MREKAFWKRESQRLKVLKVLVPMLETQEEDCSVKKESEGRWEQRGHRLRGVKHMALQMSLITPFQETWVRATGGFQ